MLLVTCDPRESWLHVHLNRDTRRMELSETGPQQAKVKTSPHASRPERFCRCEVPHNWSQLKYLVRPLTAIQGVFCLLLLKFAPFAIPGYPPRHTRTRHVCAADRRFLLTYLLTYIPHPQAVRLSHTLHYNNHVTPTATSNDTPDRQPTCSVLFPKGRRAKVHMLRTAVGRERARQVQLRRGRPHHGPSRHWRGVAAAAAAGLVGE